MHQRILNVHYLPHLVGEQDLAGSAVVVIDLLRASTTICQALASGAREVVPFLEISEVRAAAAEADRSTIVLAGERGGRQIDGFDLGNSPSEFTPQAVVGRRVFLTTTNGTRALHRARLARRVLVGALVNLSAVAASVKDEPRVDVLCAGTDGRETREDILAGGALTSRLCELSPQRWQTNHAAEQARRGWDSVVAKAAAAGRSLNQQLALEFRDAPGGRNLLAIGLENDLVDCTQIDRLDVVPELDRTAWRIIVPSNEKPLR